MRRLELSMVVFLLSQEKGTTKLTKTSFQPILHVPKLACNLLFIYKLSRDSNCRVTFFESHYIFQDQESEKMIESAMMFDGL